MIKQIDKKYFYFIFTALAILETLSYLSYFYPVLNTIGFLLIVIIALIFSMRDLRYGLILIIIELIIGSKGYLFSLHIQNNVLSLRIALWIIILSVWLWNLFRQKKINFQFKTKFKKYWLAFFLILIWGLIMGLMNKNNYNNIFFDFNNWLYLLLIFPIYQVWQKQKPSKLFWSAVLASLVWLSTKTLLLLFAFSHNLGIKSLYRWLTDAGMAEITMTTNGFYRIFFQSHIYIVFAFFASLFFLQQALRKKEDKDIVYSLLAMIVLVGIIIISLSRSFWVGTLIGLFFYLFILIYYFKAKIKEVFLLISSVILSTILSFVFIFGIIKLPIIPSTVNFSMNTISERINSRNEAAVVSRWSLLPKLWQGIENNMFFGHGFGTTITYQSHDPRAVEHNIGGIYTTYAFEWGWLGFWFKVGLLGLLVYLFLLFKIIQAGCKQKNMMSLFISFSLLIIVIIHIFTPYLNHPLGLGFLLLASLFIDENDS